MKYKCNDCEHVFEGSSYSTECPECESNSFIPFKNGNGGGWLDKIKERVKENKLITAVIAVILLLIIWPRCEDLNNNGICDNDEVNTKIVYSLEFFEPSDEMIIVYLKDSTGRVAYNQSKYDFLDLSATIESEDGNTYRVKVKKNIIEICSSGELTITYKTPSSSGLSSLTGMFTGVKSIAGVNPTKQVGECMPNVVLGNVYYNESICTIVVPVLEGIGKAKISINGKNGNYQNSSSFNTDGVTIKNLDIWYYPKGFKNETVQYKDFDKQKVIDGLNKKSTVNSVISPDSFKSDLLKMINLVKNGDNNAAQVIYNRLSEYVTDDQMVVLNGDSISFWTLMSDLDSANLINIQPNISNVKVASQRCKIAFTFDLSL
jgi:hypothetical protein